MTRRRFNDQTEQEIFDRKASGETFHGLARVFRVARTVIKGAIRRHTLRMQGITPRPTGKPRQYRLNEAAFDDAMTNPDAAYFIGLIMADGCITHRKYTPRLSIGLAGDDGVMVERLREFLGTDHPTYTNTRYGGFHTGSSFTRIAIDSKRIAAKLAEFGVHARKSMNASVVGLESSPDFWRGVIDGDGYLTIPKGEHLPQPCIGVVGSQLMLNQFAAFVQSFTECRAKVAPMQSIWRFETKGRFAVEIIRRLYGYGGMSLPRKQAVADQVMADFLPNGRPKAAPAKVSHSHLTREHLQTLYYELGRWTLVAKHLGMGVNTLNSVRRQRAR